MKTQLPIIREFNTSAGAESRQSSVGRAVPKPGAARNPRVELSEFANATKRQRLRALQDLAEIPAGHFFAKRLGVRAVLCRLHIVNPSARLSPKSSRK